MSPTAAETRAIAAIKEKDRKLRAFLEAEVLAESADPVLWLTYLAGIKAALSDALHPWFSALHARDAGNQNQPKTA